MCLFAFTVCCHSYKSDCYSRQITIEISYKSNLFLTITNRKSNTLDDCVFPNTFMKILFKFITSIFKLEGQ